MDQDLKNKILEDWGFFSQRSEVEPGVRELIDETGTWWIDKVEQAYRQGRYELGEEIIKIIKY